MPFPTLNLKRLRRLGLACAATLLLAGSPLANAGDDALYRDLGGREGIRKIVEVLIPIVLDDARIQASFEDVDLENLADKLEEQFCDLSGGPCQYSGKDMQTIHEGLELTQAHFNALAEDLQEAMSRQGIPTRVQNQLLALLAPMQRDIVTK